MLYLSDTQSPLLFHSWLLSILGRQRGFPHLSILGLLLQCPLLGFACCCTLCDLCLSFHSPTGATHGVSDHDPIEDLASPVMLPLPPSPSPSGQPWTAELPVLLSWFSLGFGRTLGVFPQLRQGEAKG